MNDLITNFIENYVEEEEDKKNENNENKEKINNEKVCLLIQC